MGKTISDLHAQIAAHETEMREKQLYLNKYIKEHMHLEIKKSLTEDKVGALEK